MTAVEFMLHIVNCAKPHLVDDPPMGWEYKLAEKLLRNFQEYDKYAVYVCMKGLGIWKG